MRKQTEWFVSVKAASSCVGYLKVITQSVYIQFQNLTLITSRPFWYGVDSSVFGYGLAGLYFAMNLSLIYISSMRATSRINFAITVAVSTIRLTIYLITAFVVVVARAIPTLRCWLAVFANMSNALELKTSYNLYQTLLKNHWTV